MRAVAVVVGVVVVGPAARAEAPLDRARAAVAAAPDRPGLRLVLAEMLFEAGDLAAAEVEANRVLSEHVASHRARLLLARIDAARGFEDTARDTFADVAARAPAPIAAEALRLLDRPVPSAWRFGARVGVDYDSAVYRGCVESGDGRIRRCEDEDTARVVAAADVGYERPLWAVRLGGDVGRDAPGSSRFDDDVPPVASAWADARREHPVGPARVGGRLEARAVFEDGLHHAGGGGAAWIRGLDPALAPWLQLRVLYAHYPEVWIDPFGDPEPVDDWQTEAAAGLRAAAGRLDGGLRVAALWVPDAFREYGADLDGGLDLAPVRLFVRAGAGWRDYDGDYRDDGPWNGRYGMTTVESESRPRAGGGVALALGGGFATVAEARWQAALAAGDDELRDRLIAGLRLEFRR